MEQELARKYPRYECPVSGCYWCEDCEENIIDHLIREHNDRDAWWGGNESEAR